MRKALYKGKRKRDGVWIYGFYYIKKGKHFILGNEYPDSDIQIAYMVISETVSEYTGMNDRFEVMVFEGDIITLRYQQGHEYVVFWNEKTLAWCAKLLPWCAEKKETNIPLSDLQEYKTTLEHLGSKHDSPTFGDVYA